MKLLMRFKKYYILENSNSNIPIGVPIHNKPEISMNDIKQNYRFIKFSPFPGASQKYRAQRKKINGDWESLSYGFDNINTEEDAFNLLHYYLNDNKIEIIKKSSIGYVDVSKYPVSDDIINNKSVQWVAIDELEQIKEGNRELGNQDGMSSTPRDSKTIINSIEHELKNGGVLKSPLEIWYDDDNDNHFVKLNEGNHRFAVLKRLGWKYAPVIVYRHKLFGGGLQPLMKPKHTTHKSILPSELGFTTISNH